MIKSALFIIGALLAIGGFVVAAALVLIALGNPAPTPESDHATLFHSMAGIGLFGVVMIVGAIFIPAG